MNKELHNKVGEAKLVLPNGAVLQLPVYRGSMKPDVIDVSQVLKSGYFTYDPGFVSTASCSSEISFIDGHKGVLLHRGYPIEQLVAKKSYLEIAYLLMNGDLPSVAQRKEFNNRIRYHTMVSERMYSFIKGFDATAHPMALLIAMIGATAAFYHEESGNDCDELRYDNALRLIAKVPTLAAMSYKYSVGKPFMYPQNDIGFVENILYMLFATPCEEYKIDRKVARALEAIMILHADHEQNASTSTVRLAGSTGANPFACVSAGVASLWGPSHGGANEAVLKMLAEIGTVDKIPAYLEMVRDKSSNKRLMGFGHRVYKSHDPRATEIRKICHDLLAHMGKENDETLKVAMELERIALNEDYYIKRNLYPNVDFYSGIVLRAIGIPTQMFTAIFAIARTTGWVSHWRELHNDPEFKIGRPRQLYKGKGKRNISK